MAYMADGLCMEIAWPGHRHNVFVESQTAIQHDTEHFDLVSWDNLGSTQYLCPDNNEL